MENSQIIANAVQIVNSATDEPDNFDFEVARVALMLRRQLRETSLVSRILNATAIFGTVVSVAFEESSKRYVIQFKAGKQREGFDDIESFRSDRVDGPNGRMVEQMWSNAAGRRGYIYKYLEATNDPKKPSVRLAPYIQFLD